MNYTPYYFFKKSQRKNEASGKPQRVNNFNGFLAANPGTLVFFPLLLLFFPIFSFGQTTCSVDAAAGGATTAFINCTTGSDDIIQVTTSGSSNITLTINSIIDIGSQTLNVPDAKVTIFFMKTVMINNLTEISGTGNAQIIMTDGNHTFTASHSGSGTDMKFSDLTAAIKDPNCNCSNLLEAMAFQLGVALPVTLTSFTAQTEGSSVALHWATATEENNDYFQLEHSPDGQKFDRLTRVSGAGSTLEPQEYSFVHTTPSRGLNYYRLVQADYDGATTYFDVITVEFRGKGNEWVLQPNPAQDFIELINKNSPGPSAQAVLYSLTGREIIRQQLTSGARTRMELPSNLPKGVYLLRVESGREVTTRRVLVQ